MVSAALVVLSGVAHAALLAIPLPESPLPVPSPPAASETQTNDISVLVIPKGVEATAAIVPTVPPKPSSQVPLPLPESGFPTASAADASPTPESLSIPAEISANPPLEIPPPEPSDASLTVSPHSDISEESEEAFSSNSSVHDSLPTGPLVAYSTGFPHFEGAIGGCFGADACRRVTGIGSYREVGRSLIANLETQGYRVKLRHDLEDTGRNVYELTPPDSAIEPQYLIVFSDPADGSAVYVMSKEILTLKELQSLQAQAPADRMGAIA